MAHIVINEDKCKGCGLCVSVCPKKILAIDKDKINIRGYNPNTCVDPSQCIGCAFCATVCPDVVIEVFK